MMTRKRMISPHTLPHSTHSSWEVVFILFYLSFFSFCTFNLTASQLFIRAKDMDLMTDLRADFDVLAEDGVEEEPATWKTAPKHVRNIRRVF